MRPGKGETPISAPKGKIELEIETKIIEQLKVMETYTKIPKSELVSIALKRYISQHKDYFPEDYKG